MFNIANPASNFAFYLAEDPSTIRLKLPQPTLCLCADLEVLRFVKPVFTLSSYSDQIS